MAQIQPFDWWTDEVELLFGFSCRDCSARLTLLDDLTRDEQRMEISDQCAALAAKAKELGWTCQGRGQFRCPACAQEGAAG